ncbi:MAG: dTDP-4-dehydrorhamnose 3,5-epimerase [Chloroflexi bacterium]|nr:dTDP-4-dehydrorhamnose 3,5-epimerase [Chloroflexota bacterium]
MSFVFLPQAIPDVVLIEPRIHGDERGYFLEVYKESAYASLDVRFVQENQSLSRRGVLRGIHFQQAPKAQGKLVRVTSGEILDVAVDLRAGSPTFAQHVAAVLSDENHRLLYIPPGFGHAFYVQSDTATVIYLTTEEYDPELDAGILWSDPDLRIPWPDQKPIVSKKDAALPTLRQVLGPGS